MNDVNSLKEVHSRLSLLSVPALVRFTGDISTDDGIGNLVRLLLNQFNLRWMKLELAAHDIDLFLVLTLIRWNHRAMRSQ